MTTHHAQPEAAVRDDAPPAVLGPYELIRPMSPAVVPRPASDRGHPVQRWLALHTPDETDRLVHVFTEPLDEHELDRAYHALWNLAGVPHAHLLSPECVAVHQRSGLLWAASRFVGHHERVLTLAEHAEMKGGALPPHEAERAVIQLLESLDAAQSGGILSGPLAADSILVDRRGSVCLELHGLGRALDGLRGFGRELVIDEVRSVVEIGYRLLTGHEPEQTDGLRPSRLVRRLDRAWDPWFEAGLDPVGCFECPRDALEALPSAVFHARPQPGGVIERLRRVLERPRAVATRETRGGA